MIYIGIDPGVHVGWAVLDNKNKEIIIYDTITFWQAIERIKWYKNHNQFDNKNNFKIILEDPNLNKPVFNKDDVSPGAKQKAYLRIAQNVGSNKRDAQLIHEFCTLNNIPILTVKPTTEKWDAIMLKKITGIDERTSQHVRDAIKLVYGRG